MKTNIKSRLPSALWVSHIQNRLGIFGHAPLERFFRLKSGKSVENFWKKYSNTHTSIRIMLLGKFKMLTVIFCALPC